MLIQLFKSRWKGISALSKELEMKYGLADQKMKWILKTLYRVFQSATSNQVFKPPTKLSIDKQLRAK